MSPLPEGETGLEMIQGYERWMDSRQVSNLHLRLKHDLPTATELEIRNHILNYTLVKLVVWLQPPGADEDDKKEPWQ